MSSRWLNITCDVADNYNAVLFNSPWKDLSLVSYTTSLTLRDLLISKLAQPTAPLFDILPAIQDDFSNSVLPGPRGMHHFI